jgi:uncharacterized lipoprotein YajG
MGERRTVLLAAGVMVSLLAGCTRKAQPQKDSPPHKEVSSLLTEKGESSISTKEQRVALYVEGMTKVQGIT